MRFNAEEKETVINGNDADKKWFIYTLQSSVISKLKRVGVQPTKIDKYGGHYYELDWNQVSFRSGKKRELSEEQRQKRSERMKKMHEEGRI